MGKGRVERVKHPRGSNRALPWLFLRQPLPHPPGCCLALGPICTPPPPPPCRLQEGGTDGRRGWGPQPGSPSCHFGEHHASPPPPLLNNWELASLAPAVPSSWSRAPAEPCFWGLCLQGRKDTDSWDVRARQERPQRTMGLTSHFIDGETEVQKGNGTCPRSQRTGREVKLPHCQESLGFGGASQGCSGRFTSPSPPSFHQSSSACLNFNVRGLYPGSTDPLGSQWAWLGGKSCLHFH